MKALAALQTRLGYVFNDISLLNKALTHRSRSSAHNERLEFLGDSVLNCVVASMLYAHYQDMDEGGLSRLRSNLVKQQALYEIAQTIQLSGLMRLGEGELKSGGAGRPSILADAVEAVLGAIFLDGGFGSVEQVVHLLYAPILAGVDPKTLGKDAKTLLQEYLQGRRIDLPKYQVVATHGAPHNQEFEVECLIPKLEIQVYGSGSSRRMAEQMAARLALEAAQAKNGKGTVKTPRRKPRNTQLKLIGIATDQSESAGDTAPE